MLRSLGILFWLFQVSGSEFHWKRRNGLLRQALKELDLGEELDDGLFLKKAPVAFLFNVLILFKHAACL